MSVAPAPPPTAIEIKVTRPEPTSKLGISYKYNATSGTCFANVKPSGLGYAAGIRDGMKITAFEGAPFTGTDKDAFEMIQGKTEFTYTVEVPATPAAPTPAVMTDVAVPPGAPPGGSYQMVKYCGVTSWLICCCCGLVHRCRHREGMELLLQLRVARSDASGGSRRSQSQSGRRFAFSFGFGFGFWL